MSESIFSSSTISHNGSTSGTFSATTNQETFLSFSTGPNEYIRMQYVGRAELGISFSSAVSKMFINSVRVIELRAFNSFDPIVSTNEGGEAANEIVVPPSSILMFSVVVSGNDAVSEWSYSIQRFINS